VNAFYNVCSHRSNQIAYGACGNTQTFRCSYHLWEYNLKGELINVPDAERFRRARRAKTSIKRARPGGFVWFNMNPDAEPLAGLG
jgi:phenylpropionate dioxygenase-like ring-hydroxylating dioxygenase large terminal subunit